jgi:hypothetical protein
MEPVLAFFADQGLLGIIILCLLFALRQLWNKSEALQLDIKALQEERNVDQEAFLKQALDLQAKVFEQGATFKDLGGNLSTMIQTMHEVMKRGNDDK